MRMLAEFPGRRFQVWKYSVSHRQLLLRSVKSEQHTRRFEILFKNVARMELDAHIDDLEIHVDSDVPDTQATVYPPDPWVEFHVRGRDFAGRVIAQSVFWVEDDGEYYTPSTLYSDSGL